MRKLCRRRCEDLKMIENGLEFDRNHLNIKTVQQLSKKLSENPFKQPKKKGQKLTEKWSKID